MPTARATSKSQTHLESRNRRLASGSASPSECSNLAVSSNNRPVLDGYLLDDRIQDGKDSSKSFPGLVDTSRPVILFLRVIGRWDDYPREVVYG